MDAQIQQLHDHVAWLNGLNWVRLSGKPYFVSVRDTPNGPLHYVDRQA